MPPILLSVMTLIVPRVGASGVGASGGFPHSANLEQLPYLLSGEHLSQHNVTSHPMVPAPLCGFHIGKPPFAHHTHTPFAQRVTPRGTRPLLLNSSAFRAGFQFIQCVVGAEARLLSSNTW
jgi:hypothetical protein